MTSSQNSSPQRQPNRVELEAIAWFTRMNGEPSAADRRDFERWRKVDPGHDSAYRRVVATWNAADGPSQQIAEEEAYKLNIYLEAIGKVRERRRRFGTGFATLGAMLVLVLGANIWLNHPHLLQDFSADHIAGRAERRTVTLPDGTSVLLDADSALSEHFDGAVRRVELLRGAAYFDVAASPVPFVVKAGDGETRVTGTAFSVEVLDDVVVTLARGSVTIRADADGRQARLEPAQSVSYGSEGLGAVRPVLLDDVLAWKDGRLIFENVRLEDVISQLGRYHAGRIVILGPQLGEHRVSGNLPLEDADAALASLQSTVGFRMNGAGGLVIIGP